jgi:multidrug resistance efflux pump
LGPLQTNSTSGIDAVIQENIHAAQAEIQQLYKPTVLRAPIAGRVNSVFYHAGTQVPSRSVILTINPHGSDRVIAYLRQPIISHPQIGDPVAIRTRTLQRREVRGQVIQVGSQLEPINSLLLPWAASTGGGARRVYEVGLPVVIKVPADVGFMQGEIVELALLKK